MIACLLLQDQQRLIAAGKVQRWDVAKWVVAVNLGLATASIGIGKSPSLFFLFSVLVAAAGGYLVYHYNKRMSGARSDADATTNYLGRNGIDLSKIVPQQRIGDRSLSMYDAEELNIFGYIIGFSILPSFFAWVFQLGDVRRDPTRLVFGEQTQHTFTSRKRMETARR